MFRQFTILQCLVFATVAWIPLLVGCGDGNPPKPIATQQPAPPPPPPPPPPATKPERDKSPASQPAKAKTPPAGDPSGNTTRAASNPKSPEEAAAELEQSKENLQRIALAFHNFEAARARFPGGTHESTRVGQNWEVQILPFVGEKELFDSLRSSKATEMPWFGPVGKEMLDKMPDVFLSPGDENHGQTRYRVFSGPGTLFADDKGTSMRNIRDGTSRTLLLIEVGPDKAVPWSQPGGIPIRSKKLLAELGSPRDKGYLAATADGRIITIKKDIDAKTLRALITPAGLEGINEADYLAK